MVAGGAVSAIEIRLDARESECIACGAPLTDPRQGLPLYEGRIVKPDDSGPWGGYDACLRCWQLYEDGRYEELQAIMARWGRGEP